MKRMLLVLSCALLLGGCAGVRVKQDYDTSVDFDKLKTYDWIHHETNNASVDNSLINERVKKAVDTTLAVIGYNKKTSGNVDFLVDYDYNITRESESGTTTSTSVSMGLGGGGFGFGGVGLGVGRERHEEIETLGIAVIDPVTNKLMWRGFTQQEYMRHTDPNRSANDIKKTIEEILTKFPPVKKSK